MFWATLVLLLVGGGCQSGSAGPRPLPWQSMASPDFQVAQVAGSFPDAAAPVRERDGVRPEPSGQLASNLGEDSNDPGRFPVEAVSFQEALPRPELEPALPADADPGQLAPLVDQDGLEDEATGDRKSENVLDLAGVLASVQASYPAIEVAIGEIESANGKVLASWGEFDSVLAAQSISQPLGFYQTYRNGAGLTRPLYGGGNVYGTYRIGDGNFEPWYGERETNEGGEFKAGFSLPLLKDRTIDQRRATLQSAGAATDRVQADVASRLLQFERFATQAYWDWVASGRGVQIQQRLLDLALDRVEKIDRRVLAEDLPRIARIDNDRFIAKRRNDLIKARRALEKAAIKLSLFYRDAVGQPIIAGAEQLPDLFPTATRLAADSVQADISGAITVRPEMRELMAQRRGAEIDLQQARNLTLPKVDMKGFAGQDVGGAASSKGDKTPFEMQLGVYAEVPLQRRKGRGEIQIAAGKLTQVDAKLRLTRDKIRAEVQDAASALNAAYDQIEQSRENVELTRQSLDLGKLAFQEGDIDLIALNIYETAVADAELQLLDAQFKYFFYRTVYQTAVRGNAFPESSGAADNR